MKKIILSLAVIAMVAAVGTMATVSYFSDSAISTSNSFMAGTLDLKLSDELNGTYSNSITGTFDMSDMAPGGAGVTGIVYLKNTGTVPGDHIRIASVVNTPSDHGINGPECNIYEGEWEQDMTPDDLTWHCVKPGQDETWCNSYGSEWRYFGDGIGYKCVGYKDGQADRNDIDKYLQITSIKYAGQELQFSGGADVISKPTDGRADLNGNGYIDLDDLEVVAAGGSTEDWLGNLTPIDSPHSFQMTVKLHEDADNNYQTDKNGIKIEFLLNQDLSQ